MMAVSGTSGCFGKVSIEAAKREVQSTLNPGKIRPPASPHQKDPEFSAHAKKLFESAQIVSEPQSVGITCCGQPDNTNMHNIPDILYTPAWHLLLQESKRTGMSTITVEHLVIALLHNGSTCRGILARSAGFPNLFLCLREQPAHNLALLQAGLQSRRCQSQCTQKVAR